MSPMTTSTDPFRLCRFDLTSIFLYLCSMWAGGYPMTLSIYVHPPSHVISFPICANVFWTSVRLSGNDGVVIFRLATMVGLAELLCANLDCFETEHWYKKETWGSLELVFEFTCVIGLDILSLKFRNWSCKILLFFFFTSEISIFRPCQFLINHIVFSSVTPYLNSCVQDHLVTTSLI